MLGVVVDNDSNKAERTSVASKPPKSDASPSELVDGGLDAIERTVVEYEANGIDAQSENSLFYAATFFDAMGKDCMRISKLPFSEAQAKRKRQLLQRARTLQSSLFPKIRDAYGPVMRKKLWEQDLHVKTVGNGYTTIQLAHHSFAANANKKKIVDSMWSDFLLYRFKRVETRWYKEESEYTYWDIPSSSDDEIIDVHKRSEGACS